MAMCNAHGLQQGRRKASSRSSSSSNKNNLTNNNITDNGDNTAFPTKLAQSPTGSVARS